MFGIGDLTIWDVEKVRVGIIKKPYQFHRKITIVTTNGTLEISLHSRERENLMLDIEPDRKAPRREPRAK